MTLYDDIISVMLSYQRNSLFVLTFQKFIQFYRYGGMQLCTSKLNCLDVLLFLFNFFFYPAQLAGAAEQNTPTVSLQRGKTTPPSTSVLDMTLNQLMVRLQSWSSGAYRVLLHCLYFQVHSDLEWQYLLGSHLWVKQNSLIIYYI